MIYFLALRFRRFMMGLKYWKLCFKCQLIQPLFMFDVNPSKYQRPSEKGRGYSCKSCARKYKKTQENTSK